MRDRWREFSLSAPRCDIGGTNARFAFVPAPGAPLEIGPHLKTKDFRELEDGARLGFGGSRRKPRSLIACAAGPVSGRGVKLTNADWTIDGLKVAARAGLEQGLLLNDFEAQAFSLPVLEPAWMTPIGTGYEQKPGVELILGLGTGLGAAALVGIGDRHLVLPSEAGHMDFGPLGAEEAAIWRHLETGAEAGSCAETVLSGAGLLRLHQARCAAAGKVPAEVERNRTDRNRAFTRTAKKRGRCGFAGPSPRVSRAISLWPSWPRGASLLPAEFCRRSSIFGSRKFSFGLREQAALC